MSPDVQGYIGMKFQGRRVFATEAQRHREENSKNPYSKLQRNIHPDGRLWKAIEPWGSLKSEVQGPKGWAILNELKVLGVKSVQWSSTELYGDK